MANVNSDRFNVTPYKPKAGEMGVAYATYEIASALSKNDTVTFFDLPQGAQPIDGWLRGDDIDTGTEALEIDVGNSSDPDKYLNSGVITGDAVTGTKPEAGILLHLGGTFITAGHVAALTADETVIGTIVAAANSGGTGSLALYMSYTSE